MFEIDKEAFGAFIASLRREKGYTQKDLSARLFISDKAVSKWERGLSMPDITLLMPLADILGVTVAELLEGRRMESSAELDTEQVDTLVKKALTLSDDTPEKKKKNRRKNFLTFGACALLSGLELAAGHLLGCAALDSTQLLVMELLSFIFGVYFWFFVRERLPTYYDDNALSTYSDGIFRLNLLGVNFNNSNWPHIVKVGRVWTAVTLATFPLFAALLGHLPASGVAPETAFLLLYLAGLFVPMYVVGRKYQ